MMTTKNTQAVVAGANKSDEKADEGKENETGGAGEANAAAATAAEAEAALGEVDPNVPTGTGLFANRDILIDGVAFAAGDEIPDTVDPEQVKICVRLGSVGGAPVQAAAPSAE